jgi:EAL domain-containing protein (putative c-di-GMP-specific phosphodiesterase class I)
VRNILGSISEYEQVSAEPYRFSDDVFVVLLRNASPAEVEIFCKFLTKRFEEPWHDETGNLHYFEITAGVASYPESGNTPDVLFRAATLSILKAEEYGVNSYAFFSETFEKSATQSFGYAQILRTAVKNDMKGLAIKYMPVYSAGEPGQRLISCEANIAIEESALAEYSLEECPPNVLMKIAAKMGIDTVIGEWLIKRACEFCRLMREKDERLTVSIGATARSLTAGTIVGVVKNALEETSLPANGLAIRFSERTIAINYDKFMDVLAKFNKIGVWIAVDNAGSYYNLATLIRHSMIHSVSGDVTLFTGHPDQFSENYIANLIEHARANGVRVGVKSVANEEQQKAVTEAEADWYQSDYGSGTMTEEEILAAL